MKKTNFTRPKHLLKNNQGVLLRSYKVPKTHEEKFWDLMRFYQAQINQHMSDAIIYGRANVNITSDSAT